MRARIHPYVHPYVHLVRRDHEQHTGDHGLEEEFPTGLPEE